MIARCIDPEGIPELNGGWEYEVQILPAHALRVWIGDAESIVCARERFRVLRE